MSFISRWVLKPPFAYTGIIIPTMKYESSHLSILEKMSLDIFMIYLTLYSNCIYEKKVTKNAKLNNVPVRYFIIITFKTA